MRKSQISLSPSKATLFFPPALGDGMMTLQALSVFYNFISELGINAYAPKAFIPIYRKIFDKWTFLEYPSNDIDFEIQCRKVAFLIDFRSDDTSTAYRSLFLSDEVFYFDFRNGRKIIYEQVNRPPKIFDTVKIKDRAWEIGTEIASWKMDAELISTFISVSLKYNWHNYATPLLPNISMVEYRESTSQKEKIFEVFIFPCGTTNAKKWPTDRWLYIINELRKINVPTSIFLGPQEKSDAIFFKAQTKVFVDTSWESILPQLHKNLLVVANDCGPMHVCGVLGHFLIGIFGPTNPKVWFTYHEKGVYLRGNGEDWPTVDMVLDKIVDLRRRIEADTF